MENALMLQLERRMALRLDTQRGAHVFDHVDELARTGHHLFSGRVTLTPGGTGTWGLLYRDVSVLLTPRIPIDRVVWHFYPGEDQGGHGPDAALRDELVAAGIEVMIH